MVIKNKYESLIPAQKKHVITKLLVQFVSSPNPQQK